VLSSLRVDNMDRIIEVSVNGDMVCTLKLKMMLTFKHYLSALDKRILYLYQQDVEVADERNWS